MFAVAVSLVTGVSFGILPALRATRLDLNAALKVAGGPAAARSRSPMKPLIALQVGLAIVLVTGAALFGRSLYNLYHVDIGFDAHHHLSVVVDTRMAGYNDDGSLSALYRRLTERLEAVPEVTSVSVAMLGLMANNFVMGGAYQFPGVDRAPVENIGYNTVGPRFVQASGMRLLAGRDISEHDTAGARNVAVVNAAFAREYFGTEAPVGRHFIHQQAEPVQRALFDTGNDEGAVRADILHELAEGGTHIKIGKPPCQ
jgi:hypothetical protein